MKYKRVLIKLSGEALGITKQTPSTIDPSVLSKIAQDISEIVISGVQVGIVTGGGNWFRGSQGAAMNLQRVTADQVGMLATLMNALVLRDALEYEGLNVKILSSIPMMTIVESFEWKSAQNYLRDGKVIILGAGTGHPLVSTDSAASLRALEIEADILLKASSVDGVYSADPSKDSEATLYSSISYDRVIQDKLAVMDLAAFIQCQEHGLPIRIFNIHTPRSLVDIIAGKEVGTLVSR